MPYGNYTTLTPITVPRTTAKALTHIPAAALILRATPHQTTKNLLLNHPIALLWTWHPALAALLGAAGATQKDATTYTLPVKNLKTHTEEIKTLLNNTVSNLWCHRDQTPLTSKDLATVFKTTTPPETAKMPPETRVLITRTSRTITFTLQAPPLVHKTHTFPPGQPVRLTLEETPPVLRALRKNNTIVFTATPPETLHRIKNVWDRHLTLTPARTAGHARLSVGKHITGLTPSARVPLDQAHKIQTRTSGGVHLAVDPRIQTGINLTHPKPAHIPPSPITPTAWQRDFINHYQHIKNYGLVNTLPPGCGKTLAVLLAWNTANHTRPLVIAPLTLHETWRAEIRKLHPHIPIHSATPRQPNPPAAGPVITLATPHIAATCKNNLQNFDALCFDEGTYLANPTPTSRQLWELRQGLNIPTLILTGTPPVKQKYGQLVKLAQGHAPTHPSVGSKTEHFGPWVFPASMDNYESPLPAYVTTTHSLRPDALTCIIDACAREYTKDLLAQISDASPSQAARLTTKLRNHIDRWRQGLSSPYTLLGGTSQLTFQVKNRLASINTTPKQWRIHPPTLTAIRNHFGQTTKIRWALTHALSQPGQKLVFSNSTQALHALHQLAHSPQVALLTGDQTTADRATVARKYTTSELETLLLSAVGQQGLNLQNTDHLIHLDVPPSHSVLTQRIGRAVRIGRTQQVMGHYPTVSETADPVFWKIVQSGEAQDVLTLAHKLVA